MSALQNLLEENNYRTRPYSGRGMYGKVCLGVGVKPNQLGDMIADVMTELFQADYENDLPFMHGGGESICDAFRTMQQDSMGKNYIVYFPDTPFEESEQDEDEDE
jgi:hypothetical protein